MLISVLSCMQLGGGITEKRQGRFGDAKSMPQITAALKKAAYDPRISGIVLKVSPLSAGWAKLQEIRQYIDFFRCVHCATQASRTCSQVSECASRRLLKVALIASSVILLTDTLAQMYPRQPGQRKQHVILSSVYDLTPACVRNQVSMTCVGGRAGRAGSSA